MNQVRSQMGKKDLTKVFWRHSCLKVAIRGDDDTCIRAFGRVGSQLKIFPFLDKPEQLCQRAGIHVADLVEKCYATLWVDYHVR